MGKRDLIFPVTFLLFSGQILPFVLFILGPMVSPILSLISALNIIIIYLPRIIGVIRFKQSTLGALLHPLGIGILLVIHWHAFVLTSMGRQVKWKGRNEKK